MNTKNYRAVMSEMTPDLFDWALKAAPRASRQYALNRNKPAPVEKK